MLLVNTELILRLATQPHFEAKMVFNERGAIFLSVRQQHRECKAEGISYEDDSKGNALAAMLGPGRIEIRRHMAFSPAKVVVALRAVLSADELAFMRSWSVMYFGEAIAM